MGPTRSDRVHFVQEAVSERCRGTASDGTPFAEVQSTASRGRSTMPITIPSLYDVDIADLALTEAAAEPQVAVDVTW